MEENKNEQRAEDLNMKELDDVAGGALYPDGFGNTCKHTNKVKTGAEREDSRFIFFSQHQYQYYCNDCKQYIWVDEERN